CAAGGSRRTAGSARHPATTLLHGPMSRVRDPGGAAQRGGDRHDPVHPTGPERRHVHHQHQHTGSSRLVQHHPTTTQVRSTRQDRIRTFRSRLTASGRPGPGLPGTQRPSMDESEEIQS
ncbi:hypothetical protein BaRGS_00034818, partial [Batillaria attramentaria]